MIVGICGGSGSGKSTVSQKLIEILGENEVLCLEQDAYYKDSSHLPWEERVRVNFDHPAAVDFNLLLEHLTLLKQCRAIDQPIYDFATHARTEETRRHQPKPIVIVEGILIFADDALLNCFDLKVFVDAEADVRLIRRIRRDVNHRSRTLESVIEQYLATVRPMYLQFVEPGKDMANIVICGGGFDAEGVACVSNRIKMMLQSRRNARSES